MGCNDTVALAVFVLCGVIPAGDHATAGRQPKETTMNILKIALLCSLRVAFFASLKVALLAYTLFLSDTAFASAVPEGAPGRQSLMFQGLEHFGSARRLDSL